VCGIANTDDVWVCPVVCTKRTRTPSRESIHQSKIQSHQWACLYQSFLTHEDKKVRTFQATSYKKNMATGVWNVALTVCFFIFAVIALVAFVLVIILWTQMDSSNGAFMTRTSVAAQSVTAATVTALLFDTNLSSSFFDYEAGSFTVKASGSYEITANLAVNTTGTGGGGSTLGPITVWVAKEGSAIHYGLNNSAPASTTPSSTNSQYLTVNTNIGFSAGEKFTIVALASTAQSILGGATTYLSVNRTGSK
jgi:hypothetical protein